MDVGLHEAIASTYPEVHASHIQLSAAHGHARVFASLGHNRRADGYGLEKVEMPLERFECVIESPDFAGEFA